jgi:hypothetical protein
MLKASSKTKTQIFNHLWSMKKKNGDKSHPIDDSLWNDPIIKNYYMMKKPVFSVDESRELAKIRNQRVYQQRKEQAEGADEKFRQGEISEQDYRRLLVGKKRLDFDLEKTIEKTRQEAQQEIEDSVEERIRHLQQSGGITMSTELGDLNNLQTELQLVKQKIREITEQQLRHSTNLLSMFSDRAEDIYFDSDSSMFQFAGLQYPTDIGPSTFYYYSALFTPRNYWQYTEGDRAPWTDHAAKEVNKRIQLMTRDWKNSLPPVLPSSTREEIAERQLQEGLLDRPQAAYNSSWDQVKRSRDEAICEEVSYELWKDEQSRVYQHETNRVAALFDSFTGVKLSPYEICEEFDTCRGRAKMIKNLLDDEGSILNQMSLRVDGLRDEETADGG